MKKIHLLLLIATFIVFGCVGNQSEKQSATRADSTSTVVSTMEDPDTTDTIPAERYGINSSNKSTADLVRLTLKSMFKTDIERNSIDSISRKFIFFEYDLNDDSKKEIFVGLTGSFFCGSGGCTFFILDNQGNELSKFTVSDYPIVIDNKSTNGWKDLLIQSNGKFHTVKYDGKKYPSNPSVQPLLKTIPGDDLPRALNFVNEPYPWFKF